MQISKIVMSIVLLAALNQSALADATIPDKDIDGARDTDILKRYDGSFIVSYEHTEFTDFKAPLSPLKATDRKDKINNTLFLPDREQELEGALTRLVYVEPEARSPLEVLRNYQDEVTAAGGEVLFECKDEECGGSSTRSSSGGGGQSSLLMYFVYSRDLKGPAFSTGQCALTEKIGDQRFFTGRLPQPSGDAYVTVQTYQVISERYCGALNGRTIAVVHVLESKGREQKMVTVSADDMARSIDASGKVALYGIYFDFDKSDIKPESGAALDEIANLLKGQSDLAVLIVGHTDNQGGFDYNVDLSKRRAEAVVDVLVNTHKINAERLRAAGVGMMAPTASNESEEGRSRNRRVELVKLN
jgi:outer membrane protein OmpA-like peptidoglycan-associated protein